MGSKGQNLTFSEHGHVAYQIKEKHKCSNVIANKPSDPLHPKTLWMGSVGQNLTFSEHGYVTYQIKENQECTNMVANILPADPLPPPPPPDPRDGVRIKLKRITNAATNKSRVEPTIFFIEKISFSFKFFSCHFYEQSFIKTVRGHKRESRMQQHGCKYFARRHPRYLGWGQ